MSTELTAPPELIVSSYLRSQEIVDWLNSVEEGTRGNYESAIRDYLIWSKQSPEQIIETARQDQSATLKLFQKYVNQKRVTYDVKKNLFRILLSYVRFHDVRIELTRQDFKKYRFTNFAEQTESLLNIETVQNVFNSKFISPFYKTLYGVMFMGGMGLQQFQVMNTSRWMNPKQTKYSIKTQLETGVRPLRIEMTAGRRSTKGKRPKYFTLVGGLPYDWLKEHVEKNPVKDDGIILRSQKSNPISDSQIEHKWIELCRKANPTTQKPEGLETRSTGWGIHRLRTVFTTLWKESGADRGVREYMLGHIVDPMSIRAGIDEDIYEKLIMLPRAWADNIYMQAEPILSRVFYPDPIEITTPLTPVNIR
jgi:hypothetical protein